MGRPQSFQTVGSPLINHLVSLSERLARGRGVTVISHRCGAEINVCTGCYGAQKGALLSLAWVGGGESFLEEARCELS